MIFLYFACLLPSIAFGSLNDENTRGAIGEFISFVLLKLISFVHLIPCVQNAILVTESSDSFYLQGEDKPKTMTEGCFSSYVHDFCRKPEKLITALGVII